jgi:hypothetical protein
MSETQVLTWHSSSFPSSRNFLTFVVYPFSNSIIFDQVSKATFQYTLNSFQNHVFGFPYSHFSTVYFIYLFSFLSYTDQVLCPVQIHNHVSEITNRFENL